MSLRKAKIISAALASAAVLCVVLLLAITLGKYTSEIMGYTSFGIEGFNAAILPPETDAPENIDSGDGTEPPLVTEDNPVTTTLTTYSLRPGMKADFDIELNDTAAHIPFRVANGTAPENATHTALQYTIKLRTANILPLEYTLAIKNDDGSFTYYKALNSKPIAVEEGEQKRYEYSFNPIPVGSDAAASSTETEAKFMIPAGGAGLRWNTHEIIAEWPATASSEEYMKEVELIEILVTVTSLNKFDDPNYGSGVTNPNEYHSHGVIVILPDSDASVTEQTFEYDVDLRSFYLEKESDTLYSFNLDIDNGVGMSKIDHKYQKINYTMEFKIPTEILELQTDPYTFDIYRINGEDTSILTPICTEYRIYDEKTGELREGITNIFASRSDVGTIPEECRLYKVYIYEITGADALQTTGKDDGANTIFVHNIHKYSIKTNNLTASDNEIAFLNKLELMLTATFTDPVPASTENQGGTETTAP